MTILVGWAPVLAPWTDARLEAVEELIPERQFADIMRFQRWQDRQARFSARLLLREILRRQRVAKALADIAVTDEGRPFIPGCGDFNIAHTSTLALCVWVPAGRVGVDVEAARPQTTIDDLLPWMSDAERRRIAASPAPMDEALQLWTAKEAVCKADGCGIAAGELPDCATTQVSFRGKAWRVRSKRRKGHAFSLACAVDAPGVWTTFRLKI